jgi:circadian clock protein KaiC
MRRTRSRSDEAPLPNGLPKAPTGIQGLDEVTGGGLPKGRPTLVCGDAGCGKTLLGMEFLVRGALQYDEPGVFVAFEETAEELTENVASLGFDLNDLRARQKLAIDTIYIERSEIEETGEYDLAGLFVRIGHAIDSIGARRVVLDTLEALFAGFANEGILRSEIRRLFRWLKQKGVTAIITGERGERSLTRHGMEEYVSDCVILLENPVEDHLSTRRLRIVKYRGSLHGTNEYPFLITARGISMLPITSLGLDHEAPLERISTGIPRLDALLTGQGLYRGSTILVTGTAGTGKTSVAAHLAAAACQRGERALYLAFEESPRQIVRNMRSIGLDLEPWVQQGLLRIHAARTTLYGLERHLISLHDRVEEFQPSVVVLDPITNLVSAGTANEVKGMITRAVDFLKSHQITGVFTSLTFGGSSLEATDVGISSLMDTWFLLREYESNGERNRGIFVLKSRGTAHSNQLREFLLTDQGVQLLDVYLGPSGVLMGAARQSQEAQEEAEAIGRRQEIERTQQEIERKRHAMDLQIAALRAAFDTEETQLRATITQREVRETVLAADRAQMARRRKADPPPAPTRSHASPPKGGNP